MTRIRHLDRALFKGVSLLAPAALVAAVAASFWQVLARFVLEAPADWTEVLTRALLIWSVLLGLALAFRHGAMLGVDLLRNLLGRLQRRWLQLLNGLIALTCTGFLGCLAWIGAQMTWRVRFQTVPSLDIPISWVYAAIPVGATLAAIAVLARYAEGTPEAELRNDAQG
jgi:TRAP-type C4-dicarboxylate transport system permease small subunit